MQIEMKELCELMKSNLSEPSCCGPWEVGKWYLIRTVTMIQTGRLESVTPQELVLSNASWIADTGRFHDCLKDPEEISESEPFVNDCIIGRGSIVDATEWHSVKVSQK